MFYLYLTQFVSVGYGIFFKLYQCYNEIQILMPSFLGENIILQWEMVGVFIEPVKADVFEEGSRNVKLNFFSFCW